MASQIEKRICTICKEEKMLSEFGNSKKGLFGKKPYCKVCKSKENLAWRKNNPNYSPKFTDETIRRINEKRRQRYAKNSKPAKERMLKWAKENSDVMRARAMQRIAQKNKATVSWADQKKIAEIYLKASRLTKESGCIWHVDHIVPLKSNFVCGLHTHDNLEVIPAKQNIAKGNRYWPDMP